MPLTKEHKSSVIQDFRVHGSDTGSSEVQIALLTNRINSLSGHFQAHKKDNHSRRGLIGLVSRRRKLLDYLKRSDTGRYKTVIKRLGLRK